MSGRRIKSLTGPEPLREGEYPLHVTPGWKLPGTEYVVSRIELRIEHRGDHGIGWFDVYSGERVVASFNERFVAEVGYDQPEG